ncbi:MAG: hypothetical protein ABW069_15575, partial [Duganella sp.]
CHVKEHLPLLIATVAYTGQLFDQGIWTVLNNFSKRDTNFSPAGAWGGKEMGVLFPRRVGDHGHTYPLLLNFSQITDASWRIAPDLQRTAMHCLHPALQSCSLGNIK